MNNIFRYHKTRNGLQIGEILPETTRIENSQDMLDIMADAGYNGCNSLIVHKQTLTEDFFDLKTKVAGEILQKFSNYRMKLAIIGDFSETGSKSLNDFIRESNRGGTICFVRTTEEAISVLSSG